MFCQIDDSDTANIAMPGSLSQSVANETDHRVEQEEASPRSQTELARVELKMAWKILMPFSRRWAATASSTPRTMPAGTV